MTERDFIGTVQPNGHLDSVTRMEIARVISQFPGKMLRVRISLYRKKRTDSQNAFYWAVVIKAVTRALRDYGNEVNEMDTHEYLKLHVMKLGRVIVGPKGVPEFVPGSTTDIPASGEDGWGDKMQMIYSWAARNGIEIPPPEKPKTE